MPALPAEQVSAGGLVPPVPAQQELQQVLLQRLHQGARPRDEDKTQEVQEVLGAAHTQRSEEGEVSSR